ncbi:MAG TPA: M48 family metallopeptidase [Chitinophagaceae bacterium]
MGRKSFLSALIIALIAWACSTNPLTGEKQLSLVSEAELQGLARQEYAQFLNQNRVVSPASSRDAEMVRRVGSRIANAVTSYYSRQGLASELAGYKWEYNLVANNEANAWCMPGGKIVVYTGLLPITQNEAALAAVVGHEVAHAVARHSSERMSQVLVQQLGGVALGVALRNKSQETQSLFNNLYGIGSSVGYTLPHSRSQELEADKYGLRFMALAGYNPREAVALWKRMKAASNGNRPPEFISTHPAEDRRINELNKIMDETIKNYYRPVK